MRLLKFPFMLLGLPPRRTGAPCATYLAQLAHVRSHQVGVAQAVRQRDRCADHAKAQNRCVGCPISLIDYCDIAVQQSSAGDPICDDVSDAHEARADELAHLSASKNRSIPVYESS